MSVHGHMMRRRRAVDLRSLHFGPNMTPMVDVVMVILVFFMVSAAFVGPEWFLKSLVPRPVGTPAIADKGTGGQKDPLDPGPVKWEIALKTGTDGKTTASGLGLNDVTLDEVLAKVAAATEQGDKERVEVLIRPGPKVPYREIIRVHEGCEKLGIGRVGVAFK